jgi:hypothetical protein
MPDAENVLPATQGTWHTVFAFLVQAVLTPAAPHTWQSPHGALPDADHVEPATQVAVLHTVSAVLVQADLTPTAPHTRHPPHGVLPDAENVLPATQRTLHTVSAVLVQADLIPAVPHVLHAPHGVMPDADHVLPALQAAGAHLQVAEGQNGGLWLQFELQ